MNTDPKATHGLWADLCRDDIEPSQADYTVIGIPYDGGAGSRKGARLAPQRIRFWSQHLTPFTEDRTRLSSIIVHDAGDIQVQFHQPGTGPFAANSSRIKRVFAVSNSAPAPARGRSHAGAARWRLS